MSNRLRKLKVGSQRYPSAARWRAFLKESTRRDRNPFEELNEDLRMDRLCRQMNYFFGWFEIVYQDAGSLFIGGALDTLQAQQAMEAAQQDMFRAMAIPKHLLTVSNGALSRASMMDLASLYPAMPLGSNYAT